MTYEEIVKAGLENFVAKPGEKLTPLSKMDLTQDLRQYQQETEEVLGEFANWDLRKKFR